MPTRHGRSLEELQHLATLQLPANDNLAGASMPWTWNTDFAMSRPIVLIFSMGGSSSWVPQEHRNVAHRDAGGGAVHSIRSGPVNERAPDICS